MKKLLIGAAATALLTACGNQTEDQVATDVADAGAVAVQSAEDALAALGNISLHGGDASQAEAALAALSLATSGEGRVTFDERAVDGANATFSNVSITLPDHVGDEDGPHIDFGNDFEGGILTVETVEFEGLDMTDAGASFARMAFNGLEFAPTPDDEPDDDDIAEAGVGEVELINPSPEVSAWIASLMGNADPAPFPTGDALGFDRLRFTDLALVAEDGDAGSSADITLGSLDFGGAQAGELGVAALNGLSVAIQDDDAEGPVNLSLGSMSVAGAKTALMGLIATDPAGADAATDVISQLFASPVEPGFDRLDITDLSFVGEGISLSMPKWEQAVSRRADGLPIAFETAPYALTLSADPSGGEAGGELAGALGMVGFQTLELTGQSKASYDPDSDLLTMAANDNVFTLKDGFSLKLGGAIGGYKSYGEALAGMGLADLANGANPDPEVMQTAVEALYLQGLELELDDNSMVDRMINLFAAQNGQDPQEVRNQAVTGLAMAPMMAGGMGIDMAIVTEATAALSSFITSPGTLTIKLDPEAPLSAESFASLEDPSSLTKEFLGLSIQHTD